MNVTVEEGVRIFLFLSLFKIQWGTICIWIVTKNFINQTRAGTALMINFAHVTDMTDRCIFSALALYTGPGRFMSYGDLWGSSLMVLIFYTSSRFLEIYITQRLSINLFPFQCNSMHLPERFIGIYISQSPTINLSHFQY